MTNNWLPSIQALVAFERAAKYGSFTQAARELNLTQGAVSRQICQLEEMLDVRLFERIRRRVVVSDAGKLYLNDVSKILATLKAATHQIIGSGSGAIVLNLAVVPTFATSWLMPRLPEFCAKHPEITINFFIRLSQFDFVAEPFDAAIHYGSEVWPGAVAHHLMSEALLPVCSPEFRRKYSIQRPEDLRGVLLLHLARTTYWQDWFKETEANDCYPLRGPRFEQISMISRAATFGLGIALLPKFLIEEELASEKLLVAIDRPLHSKFSYYLVVPETKVGSLATAMFTRWLVAEAKTVRKPQLPVRTKALFRNS